MNCPVCQTNLQMTERQGVEIDYCPKCRGVWLDRGELDKIIDRVAADQPSAPQPQPQQPPPAPPQYPQQPPPVYYEQQRPRKPDDSDYKFRYPQQQGGYYKKKKSILGELFDF